MADPFTLLVSNLNAMGFFGFLLPWLFTFAAFFALFLKSPWVEDKRIMGVLSLVIAFFVIGFGGPALGSFFVNLFGLSVMIIAVLLVIMLFVTMTGADITTIFGNKNIAVVLTGIGIIIAAIAIGSFGVRVDDSVIGIVFVIIILAVAVVFITKQS